LDITLDYGGSPIIQAGSLDWNTVTNWSDGKAASRSALSNPGSTYRVVPGARLRTPEDAVDATFPGDVLTVDGDGVYANGGTTTIGEIRFKQATDGVVRFKKLGLNGGQWNTGTAGNMTLAGHMDVTANSAIYNDNASSDRGYRIEAWLTGNGTIEYHVYQQDAFNQTYIYPLNIAGLGNTFSGKWSIVIGVLLGSAPGALGTNDITIGPNAGLETTYDLRSPLGALILDGQMFLHQADSFRAVTVGGVALAPGTYTFAQLNTLYPANFPATWTPQIGSGIGTGSGSIAVGVTPPPEVSLSFQFSGPNLQLNWSQGTLLEATNVTGPWVTNAATSPFAVSPTASRKFYRVQVQ
jgi:hypothetical protein